MTTSVAEVQGTLLADGTLVLDSKPELAPGRVRVTLQPVPDYTKTAIWQFFQRVRAAQQAHEFDTRSRAEIDADIAASRQEDEGRMLEIERIHEECERLRQEQHHTEES